MTMTSWWLFVVTVFAVCGSPGPNMLHVMSRSIAYGFARSLWTMAGCLTAVLLALAASVAGLATLLTAFPLAFEVLRWLGAAYLIWLGIKSWRAAGGMAAEAGGGAPRASSASLYRDGLLTGLSNPKLIVFAAALFPQFLSRGSPQLPQLLVLVATFVVVECGWYVAYAAGGRRLARWLDRPARARMFHRLTGGLFVAFGAGLLAARV